MINWDDFWNKQLIKNSKKLEIYFNVLNRKKKINKLKSKCTKLKL
jgi:hypothetical protein